MGTGSAVLDLLEVNYYDDREPGPIQAENINVLLLTFFCFDFCISYHGFLNAYK